MKEKAKSTMHILGAKAHKQIIFGAKAHKQTQNK
jgi:hypothetical protein